MRASVLSAALVAAIILPASVLASTKPAAPASAAAPASEEDRTLYALGLLIGRSLDRFALSPKDLATVEQGIGASVAHAKPAVELEVYGPKIQDLQKARSAALAEKERAAGAAYMEKLAAVAGTQHTPSGALVQPITEGSGPNPAETDKVKVNYEGRLIDGTVFDSSIKRGQPASFPLNGVIPCWTEALPLMKVGGKSRIVCPSKLAYGEQGSGPVIGPGATLVFEVELLAIEK